MPFVIRIIVTNEKTTIPVFYTAINNERVNGGFIFLASYIKRFFNKKIILFFKVFFINGNDGFI